MKKIIISLYSVGAALLAIGNPSIKDLLLNIAYKLLDVKLPEVNGNLSLIAGIIVILIATYLFNKVYGLNITLALIGLDEKSQTKKLKYVHMINIIELVKKLNKSNSKKIISNINEKIDDFKLNYSDGEKSYYGVAPIPLIAIAGLKFRKEKIKNYYEYNSSNDEVETLSSKAAIFIQKLYYDEIDNSSENSIVCISTTSKITNDDIKQFENMNIYSFYINKCKDNSIVSKKQLEKYSNNIVKKIYDISKSKNGKIYLLGACQSSLIFEIFRKINLNRTNEIVICNYNKHKNPHYNWGISIKDDKQEYVEMEDKS